MMKKNFPILLALVAFSVTPAIASSSREIDASSEQSSSSFSPGPHYKREIAIVQADAAAYIQKRTGMTALLRRHVETLRASLIQQSATLSDAERESIANLSDAQLVAAILASSRLTK